MISVIIVVIGLIALVGGWFLRAGASWSRLTVVGAVIISVIVTMLFQVSNIFTLEQYENEAEEQGIPGGGGDHRLACSAGTTSSTSGSPTAGCTPWPPVWTPRRRTPR